ncbi:hypothetical protein BWQ96_04822 [Gracilariopsis chorda]|uniref:Uncharacterized protein n=1 Tax=Gracilariopsis chorda TaxID=448386 RepID=A0A2V3IUK9_9FLOR|nr:hypothetical protein BWQ96_04822 [Gracilariopsis chorda]|eukprot:PXF45407.1 hypothetical protein BWQ96_04822 [Gracilariopsis chorda]
MALSKLSSKREKTNKVKAPPHSEGLSTMTLAGPVSLVEVANCVQEEADKSQGQKRKRSNGMSEENILSPECKRIRRKTPKAAQAELDNQAARSKGGGSKASRKRVKLTLSSSQRLRLPPKKRWRYECDR